MLLIKRVPIVLTAIFAIAAFTYCNKKWDDHNQIKDPSLKNNLMETISGSANLSKFKELLIKSGYDKIISSSKNYTVWAPTDQALQSLDPSIISDSVRLRQFVGNHIANQTYLSGSIASQRLKMLNGKFIAVSNAKFDSASVTTSNVYANNGVVHIIDKYAPYLSNIWEVINTNTTAAPLMRSFLLSLNHNVFDPSKATQLGINPNTGEPVYDTASGYVLRNSFLDSVMNVTDETQEYTMILLQDNAYTTEFNKLAPWFKAGTIDSTNRFSGYWLVKDLAFKGAYTVSQLPDTLVSQYGVKVPINKSAITASYRTSNGIIHVMSQMNFKLVDKFPPIIIEGENPVEFAADRNANTFYRQRVNPNTGKVFKDIYLQNYNFANFWIRYFIRNMPSMRWNAYWVAVNDVQTTPLWQQRLGIDNTTTTLPAVTVQYQNYNEVSLGQFTVTGLRNLNLFVIGPTTAATSGGTNSISLDYIKLVPAF
jgi:uncharacterized surface protein with fasciclin (FAS1) repeats